MDYDTLPPAARAAFERAQNESVVRLGDRTGEGVELIERAIETDGDAATVRVELPDAITTGDVVRHRGDHYRLASVQTVDYEYFALTVEKHARAS